MRSAAVRWILGAIALLAVLAVLRVRPWRGGEAAGTAEGPRDTLRVGFLPVTCHLTCPVTDFASKTSRATRFESQRFTDFPTVVETVKSGRLGAFRRRITSASFETPTNGDASTVVSATSS